MSKDIVKLSEVPAIDFVSSGITEIDDITGGFPRGRVTQLYGLSSVGKTSLMIKTLAAISKDFKVLYCDIENAFNIDRAVELGADLKQINYSNLSVLEDVCELVRSNIGKYDLICLDSVAMLVPRSEHEGEIGDAWVALKPRLLGQWLRIIEGDLGKSKTALVLINQMRRSMELYGEKYVLPGGMQLKFSSSLMIQLTTTSKDKLLKNGRQIGHKIHVKVTKSKVSHPYLESTFPLYY